MEMQQTMPSAARECNEAKPHWFSPANEKGLLKEPLIL